MVCDLLRPQETPEERRKRIDAALKSLVSGLLSNKVKVQVGPKGEIAFDGWKDSDRNRMTDACIYRLMSLKHSDVLRRAVAAAEMRSGRKVSDLAINGGAHSHDGGRTWHPSH